MKKISHLFATISKHSWRNNYYQVKILHVCSNYYPAHGGPQYTMKHLSENFVHDYNDEVQVVTSNSLYGPEMPLFKAIEPENENINGVDVHRFSFKRWHYGLLNYAGRGYKKIFKQTLPHRIYKYRWELDCKGIDNMMRHTDADVIMATTGNYMFCDYPFWRFRTKHPKPFVLYGALHLETAHVPAKYIQRIKASDHYIANTPYEKDFLIQQGMPAEKITVAGAATDILEHAVAMPSANHVKHELGIAADKKIILCISRQEAFKGLPVLLDAFKQLQNENVCLVIAGAKGTYLKRIHVSSTMGPSLRVDLSTVSQ